MADDDPAIAVVRSLWRAFERGGVEGVIDATDPDVVWMPFSGGGKPLRGHDDLREFWRNLRDEGAELRAHADSFERIGDCVVVSGRLRVQSWTSVSDQELVWAFHVAKGRVRRAEAFRTRAEALTACGSNGG
jgi:ketosteroid isomerase-like protein